MDAALTQQFRLEQANKGVDELLDKARTSMDGLRSQYNILQVIRIREEKKKEEEEGEEEEEVHGGGCFVGGVMYTHSHDWVLNRKCNL